MDLEKVFQNHRFGECDLPPHRICAALRLDGRPITITTREVFRDSRASQSWLEGMVGDLGGCHESVQLEQFRIIPEFRSESSDRWAGMSRVIFVLDDGKRVKGLVEGFDPVSMRRVPVREVDAQDELVRVYDVAVFSILAAFFVKDLSVRSSGTTPFEPEVLPIPLRRGQRVTLAMVWGERMRGDLRAYDPHGFWYEFFSIDPKRIRNLKRALISRRAIARAYPDVISTPRAADPDGPPR